MTDTPLPDPATTQPDQSSIFGPRHVTRLMIAIVAVVSCVIFSYGAQLVHWPGERGFQGSLAQPKMAVSGFVVALGILVAFSVIGTMVLRHRYYMAGLMVATVGLTTWAVRGGTSTYVLFSAENSGVGRRVFLQLLLELVVLFAVVGALWNSLWIAYAAADAQARKGMIRRDNMGDAVVRGTMTRTMGIFGAVLYHGLSAFKSEKEEARATIPALIAQCAIMTIFIMIVVATPQKKQVLVGVFLAGVLATALAESFFADGAASRWYWAGPLIVGAIGYLVCYFNPAGMEVGNLSGMFGAFGRILPLDYASMGCAGTLVGHWWMLPDEQDLAAAVTEPAT